MLYKEHQFFQNLADYTRTVTTVDQECFNSLIIDVGSNTVKFGIGGIDSVFICCFALCNLWQPRVVYPSIVGTPRYPRLIGMGYTHNYVGMSLTLCLFCGIMSLYNLHIRSEVNVLMQEVRHTVKEECWISTVQFSVERQPIGISIRRFYIRHSGVGTRCCFLWLNLL